MKQGLSLDDILLEPQYSDVKSRTDVTTDTFITPKLELEIPIITTNMSTITEYDMIKEMNRLGGTGFLHRFMDMETTNKIMRQLRKDKLSPRIASIGVGTKERRRGVEAIANGAEAILIDVAHGHHSEVMKQLEYFVDKKETIVGNIATYQAAKDFLNTGASALRVGIGGGSRCLTRTVTGHGVPNLTALQEVVRARNEYIEGTREYRPVILDGGIRNSGDIVKALYFGADAVCVGNIVAGTYETPGQVMEMGEKKFKKFYGMASKEAQDTHRNGMKQGTAAEGFSELVPYRGPVRLVIEELVGGIKSGISYSGAYNIRELRQKGVPILLSNASIYESKIR